jgi:polysaccharide export outer membrane protein
MTGQMYESEALGDFVRDSAPAVPETRQYVIKVGDVLDVVFLYHSNLTTLQIPVRPDGKISLPHVGDAQAAGLTPMALDSLLTDRFAEILKEPNLSVIVKDTVKKRIYVLGEVQSPGGREFARDVSIIQAIAQAGGLTKEAKANHSVLIRQEGDAKIIGVEINVDAILSGSALYNNIQLRDQDIVFVPRTRISSVVEFAEAVKTILDLPLDWYFTAWQIRNMQASYEFFSDREGE